MEGAFWRGGTVPSRAVKEGLLATGPFLVDTGVPPQDIQQGLLFTLFAAPQSPRGLLLFEPLLPS